MGGARPPPFTPSTITSKAVVAAPAEWADTLPLYLIYPQYVLCVLKHGELFLETISHIQFLLKLQDYRLSL